MENRKLEQLFKDKLSGMVIEPSPTAQDVFAKKIGLIKQRIMIRRISIAASILLLAVVGIYAFLPGRIEKVDLTQGESSAKDEPQGIAGKNNVPLPLISSEKEAIIPDDQIDLENETSGNMEEHSIAISEVTIQEDTDPDQHGSGIEALAVSEDTEIVVKQTDDTKTLEADRVDEGVHIEYAIADPANGDQLLEKQYEPVKITIEYIASGKGPADGHTGSAVGWTGPTDGQAGEEQSEADRKKFYSKLDNMKSVDEVLGDIRTYKDRLFALDFKKENKVKDEEKSEK